MKAAGKVTSLRKFKKGKLQREDNQEKKYEVIAGPFMFCDPPGQGNGVRGVTFYKRGSELKCSISDSENKDVNGETIYESDYIEFNTKQDTISAVNRIKAKLSILSQQNADAVWMIEKIIDTLFPTGLWN